MLSFSSRKKSFFPWIHRKEVNPCNCSCNGRSSQRQEWNSSSFISDLNLNLYSVWTEPASQEVIGLSYNSNSVALIDVPFVRCRKDKHTRAKGNSPKATVFIRQVLQLLLWLDCRHFLLSIKNIIYLLTFIIFCVENICMYIFHKMAVYFNISRISVEIISYPLLKLYSWIFIIPWLLDQKPQKFIF